MSDQPAFTNQLVHETSPYLRQHAHNPVDWYPWGEAAFAKARSENKPIFLSIGYSACHWCHVMEHESFEDPEIGRYLNDHFVSIKVDREERPDVDQIYMAAVQILTRAGGWPMSMFLTPDLQPFYGGTYFPPDQRYGRPSFRQVLEAVRDAFVNRREAVDKQAADLTEHIQVFGELEPTEDKLEEDILAQAANQLRHVFDADWGGFGGAPKFPHTMELRLLLRVWRRFGDAASLEMACQTLDYMAMGGLYDQLGGGFHRYSTDRKWLVPHFEKMLYDNALLVPAYIDAFQITKNTYYRTIVEETLAYLKREMLSSAGAFYSTQDADSEGEEGKFFVWTKSEVDNILGNEMSTLFCQYYDVSTVGNWEGHNILNLSAWAKKTGKSVAEIDANTLSQLREARKKLLEVRSRRIWPGRDEKVLTAWNALMIDAFAQAAQVFPEQGYEQIASTAADFLLSTMRQDDGRLYRTYFTGQGARLNGYLEDYAFLLNALVSLYEATFSPRWLREALQLVDVMISEFWDSQQGGFFFTGKSHEQLIARGKEPQDGSIPSGNSMAVTGLLRLAKFTGQTMLQEKASETLQLYSSLLRRSPQAAGQMLLALDFHIGPVDELAVIGQSDDETQNVLRLICEEYNPLKVVAFRNHTDNSKPDLEIPLLSGKNFRGQVTTYVCRDFTCGQPQVGQKELAELLAKRPKLPGK